MRRKVAEEHTMSQQQFIPEVWSKAVAAALESSAFSRLFPPPTDEGRERIAARRAARAEYESALCEALAGASDPVLLAVADLHKADDRGECYGCEFGGFESEAISWPCRTSELLGTFLGVEAPGA